jgi:hypothetical protein
MGGTMTRNLRRTFGICCAVTVALTACTDLTTEPKSSVTGANIFNEAGSYRAFLARLYGGLAITGQQGPAGRRDIEAITDEGFSSYLRLFWNLQELPTDEAIIAWGDPGLPELNTQNWGSTNQFLSGMYSRVYFQVSLANEFLRQTTDAVLSERGVPADLRADIQEYRAEARFLRALSYWHGIDLFGGIPLVTEDDPIGATPPQASTRQEVFDFLVAELNAIRADLPAAGTGEYGRADQGAVSMLLAKLYLNAEAYGVGARYGDVVTALQAVLTGQYQLDPDYEDMFLADNHTSPEIVFAVPQDGERTQTWGGTTFLIHAAVGGSMNAADYGVDFGWWGLRVRPQLVELFPGGASGPDGRAHIFYTDGQQVSINSVGDFTQGLAAPKFRNVTSTGEPGSHPTFPDTDFPMFRLADAYLMYAEAVTRGGGGSRATALQYINALRARAYGSNSGAITDAQLTTPFIIAERGRELYWEAHRRTDLVRFGQFSGGAYLWAWKGGSPGGTATDPGRNVYPLPASECVANPNLKGIGGC